MDLGNEFINNSFQYITKLLNIGIRDSSAYYKQSKARVEIMHKLINKSIRFYKTCNNNNKFICSN